MPIKSKIKSKSQQTSSRAKEAKPVSDRTEFYCDRCGKKYKVQRANFLASQSAIYRGNNGYLSICKSCIHDIYLDYKEALQDDKAAIRRVCLHFDFYWHPDIYAMLKKNNTNGSRMAEYVSRTNLFRYVGKTYDDTLDEEKLAEQEAELEQRKAEVEAELKELEVVNITDLKENLKDREDIKITKKTIQFWGTGFTPEMYAELEERYKYWVSTYPKDYQLTPGEQAMLRQICNLEISINQDRVAGKPIEKSVNTLNTLLGGMNMRPAQNKQDADSGYDKTPMGVWIKRLEEERPVSEVDPELADVDGLKKYISTWFYGHLGKMLNIKNTYSQLYEDEIAKWRVEQPNFEGDDEELLNSVLGGDDDGE